MQCTIRCSLEADVYCPRCGSNNIVARGRAASHCGNCGTGVIVELVKSVNDAKNNESFTQLSLF
uniref:hypothetical protein n=1 Tax=Acetatifactor sp. TaxID=1872090 RepID=UPI004055A924